ncbi:MAG TPA: hypothetical protein VF064_15830 [Pyrinomonadaceae bacterium]
MAGDLETVQDELTRRHRAAVMFIVYVFALTVLLVLLAFARLFDIDGSGSLAGALRIVIAVFGLGAVMMRRTMFSAMRLKDIAALGGPAALLETLYKTTVYVALLAAAIAVMAFVISLITGDPADMIWFGLVAVAVLLYAYPRRAAWQSVLRMTAPPASPDATAAKGTIA